MRVKFVTARLLGRRYQGMNPSAAKELKVKHKPPAGTIWCLQSLSRREKHKTVAHEIYEYGLMRKHGLRYREADRLATRFEGRLGR